jgi:hypothetical protein
MGVFLILLVARDGFLSNRRRIGDFAFFDQLVLRWFFVFGCDFLLGCVFIRI